MPLLYTLYNNTPMNFYKYILLIYYKIVFLVLSKLTKDSFAKDYEYSIDINNNNINLIEFTLETFYSTDLKPLLFNFNHSNIISASHFLNNTSPSYLSLFNSEGKLFGHYQFHIHNPDNEGDELGFDLFVASLSKHIFKNCIYETMKNNVSTNDYKFYMNISNKNILDKKISF
jgi:hypothetical protein